MDFITETVGQAPSRELPPGVLHVRTDCKRIYVEAFKADLVRKCQVPGISVAARAMAHGINANLLRRWIGQQIARGALVASPPALLPVTVQVLPAAALPPPSASVYIARVHRDQVSWCTRSPARCGRCTTPWRRAQCAGAALMMGLPASTRVWIAVGHTDMRKGFDGLAASVQTALAAHAHLGHVSVFRGRRSDIIKLLWSDG